MRKKCECGCGGLVTPSRRFIRGHNSVGSNPWNKGLNKYSDKRIAKQSEKISIAKKGKPRSVEIWNKGLNKFIDERVAKNAEKISIAHTGSKRSDEVKKNMSIAQTGRQHNSKTKKELSISSIKNWQDPEYVKKQYKARAVRPNKPETYILNLLNRLYPNEWKYTGNFSFTINGKCPDFTNCNGQKKVIEFNGSYWHQDDIPGHRESIFAEFGYQTLIIWDYELKNFQRLKAKIRNFHVKMF